MSILATLSWGRGARLVLEAIASARAGEGPVLVAGAPGLAKLLRDRGLEVVLTEDPRAFSDGALAAMVLRGGEPRVTELRAVRPGGAVVLVGAPPAAEQSRRAICAGLVDLEQRRAGRLVVTSGRMPIR